MTKSLFDKLWDDHVVLNYGEDACLLHIDRIFLHERTGSIALKNLQSKGRELCLPQQAFCTMDHIIDTFPGRGDETLMPSGSEFIKETRKYSHALGVNLFDITDPRQGIAHVVSPEQGIALPGCTLVCPDSHTSTVGALGALAWGIGSSEAEHALVTQTLVVRRPKSLRVVFDGPLADGVTAKDMILHLIHHYGAKGGAGYAIEYAGSAVRDLPMEARFTLCNMSVEFSAFAGFIAVDESTLEYVKGRPFAPEGNDWHKACPYWRDLVSDEEASFDREIHINSADIAPMVTWGTNPEQAMPISGKIPALASFEQGSAQDSVKKALDYMDLEPERAIAGLAIDAAFIGSCTNSRISDLRAAAAFLKGKKVADGVKAICVPGSTLVKSAAEAEGLDKIFTDAGFEWRESGCSMCFFAGGESFGYQQRVISTTNRNFESRQGPQTRTHLASPITVAASAVMGKITDARDLKS